LVLRYFYLEEIMNFSFRRSEIFKNFFLNSSLPSWENCLEDRYAMNEQILQKYNTNDVLVAEKITFASDAIAGSDITLIDVVARKGITSLKGTVTANYSRLNDVVAKCGVRLIDTLAQNVEVKKGPLFINYKQKCDVAFNTLYAEEEISMKGITVAGNVTSRMSIITAENCNLNKIKGCMEIKLTKKTSCKAAELAIVPEMQTGKLFLEDSTIQEDLVINAIESTEESSSSKIKIEITGNGYICGKVIFSKCTGIVLLSNQTKITEVVNGVIKNHNPESLVKNLQQFEYI